MRFWREHMLDERLYSKRELAPWLALNHRRRMRAWRIFTSLTHHCWRRYGSRHHGGPLGWPLTDEDGLYTNSARMVVALCQLQAQDPDHPLVQGDWFKAGPP